MRLFRKREQIYGVIDHPTEGQLLEGAVQVSGWAIGLRKKKTDVEILIDGQAVEALIHRTPRPDVHQVHTRYASRNPLPGYLAEISVHNLSSGEHTLSVRAQSGRAVKIIGEVRVQVPADREEEAAEDNPLYFRTSALASGSNRLLLVHIPKTAGTSLTAYLTSHYRTAQMLIHAENEVLGHSPAELGRLDHYELVTAHLNIETIGKYLYPGRYFSITVLRDPKKQLASHLAWVKRLADPKKILELSKSPPYIQRAVERIKTLDLVEFLDTMDANERSLFDNCQFRYMLPLKTQDVDENQVLDALNSMQALDLVGTTERLYDFLLVLAFSMGWEAPPRAPRLNTGKKENFFDFENADEALRVRIDHLTRLDQVIYSHAQTLFETRFRGMLKVLSQEAGWPHDEKLTAGLIAERLGSRAKHRNSE